MNCPECGTATGPDDRYCYRCGRGLAPPARGSGSHSHPAWKRWSIGATLGVATLLMLWLLLIPRVDANTSLVAGEPAPPFDLESVDGGRVSMADLKGKPVILNFWASWCKPCRQEMPDFQAIYDQYHARGLEVYGINLGESKVAVGDYRERVGVTFPILLDTDEKAQTAYKILPIPATFFIDKDGVIRAIYQYQMSRAQMEAEVERLLSQ